MEKEKAIMRTWKVPAWGMTRYLVVLLCAVSVLVASGLPAHAMRIAVSGAGTTAVNGTYTEVGESNGKQSYSNGQYRIEWFNNGMVDTWGIREVMSLNQLYGNNSTSVQPPEADWYTLFATAPAPAMVLLSFQDVTVSGAGTTAVNGTYMQIGLSNGKPRYSLGGTQSASYYLEWAEYVMGFAWTLKSNSGTQLYTNSSDTPAPPANGWFPFSGSSPAPTLPNIPKQLSYQGYLKNATNVPVNGPVSLTFKLYNVATGGNVVLWSETQTVTVSNGIYSVLLGASTHINLPFNETYYLGVTVGTDPELSPRQQLTGVPYALNAASVLNGVVTTGSYADPSWITSLSGSKITGSIADPAWVTSLAGSKVSGDISGNAANVSGTVAISKGGTGATDAISALTNLGAASTGHTHDSAYTKKYNKVAIVSPTNGDYSTPLDAINNLSNWCRGNLDTTTPCLIKVLPGTYDHQGESLMLKPYVDIEGSGKFTTVVNSNVTGNLGNFGVVIGANNVEVRSLTLSNNSSSSTYAVDNNGAATRYTDLIISRNSGTSIGTGVYNFDSIPVFTNVTISVTGNNGAYGMTSNFSSPVLNNVSVIVDGGSGSGTGIINNNSSQSRIANSTVKVTSGGTYCYGIYSNISSPTITDVSISTSSTGSTGSNNYGMILMNSPAVIRNAVIAVSGGDYSYGVSLSDSSASISGAMITVSGTNAYGLETAGTGGSPVGTGLSVNVTSTATGTGIRNFLASPLIKDSEVTVSGESTNNFGVRNYNSSSTMKNLLIKVSGVTGSNNRGIENNGSSPVLDGITALVSGTASSFINYGILNGIHSNIVSQPVVANSIFTASGGLVAFGMHNDNSEPSLLNSNLLAQGALNLNIGMNNVSATATRTIKVDRSTIGGTTSVSNETNYKVKIGSSRIGAVSGAAVTYSCVNSYADNGTDFVALPGNCVLP